MMNFIDLGNRVKRLVPPSAQDFLEARVADVINAGTLVYDSINEKGTKDLKALSEAYEALDGAIGGRLPYGASKAVSEPNKRKAADVFGVKTESTPTPVPQSVIPNGQSTEAFVEQGPAWRETEPKRVKRFVRGSEKWTDADANNPITTYIDEIPDKGAFPVVTLNPTHEAIMTAAKYAAGPLGKPVKILRSPETSKQLQKQIDGASVRDGKLYHGLGEENYENTKFPSNLQGAGIVGQFIGEPGYDNKVKVNELYDTLGDGYHQRRLKENLKNLDLINSAESVGNIVFRGLDDIGWANMYPRGKEQVIGELKPGHPLYRGGPGFSRGRQE